MTQPSITTISRGVEIRRRQNLIEHRRTSAGHYEDKEVMGYKLPRLMHGKRKRASPANRDTTPPLGRAPSLEGPRGYEVDLLPPLAFHPLYCFGALEALTTLMHLGVDVSDSIFQPLYLFQLAMQLFLQLTIPMHFGAESIVSEAR
jgi:hypothetical protein